MIHYIETLAKSDIQIFERLMDSNGFSITSDGESFTILDSADSSVSHITAIFDRANLPHCFPKLLPYCDPQGNHIVTLIPRSSSQKSDEFLNSCIQNLEAELKPGTLT